MPDGDLVTVQKRRGLRPQANSVDPHLRLGRCRPNRGGARRSGLHYRVPRLHPLTLQHHFIVRRRSDGCLTGGYGVPLAADFEMDHRYPEENDESEKRIRRYVAGQAMRLRDLTNLLTPQLQLV